MTDSSNFFGPPQGMAQYDVYGDMETERLREMVSDWPRVRDHMKECDNCEAVGDAEYDGHYVDNGIWWCADCIKTLVKERLDDDGGMTRLFDEIGRTR